MKKPSSQEAIRDPSNPSTNAKHRNSSLRKSIDSNPLLESDFTDLNVINVDRPPILNIPQSIYGGSEAEMLNGGIGNDLIYGLDGDDQIDGGGGADQVFGGNGHDTIDGGDGADVLQGNGGHDRIFGGWESDLIYGGSGDDLIYGDVIA